ncbi:MAG: hypothetical protein KZQ85_06285 [Candidatus Thiodiazotropha sp. (ex Myrtea sp. 'scaly one' KF741663)]|nr:hypothetical protein [Candidatus Thiodiazotropha sp. (ex Myrtea sp. 'scaly one' KF741663)]
MSAHAKLTQEKRQQLSSVEAGHDQTKTAEIVGVNKSTIGRELSRNCTLKGYHPKQDQLAITLRQEKVKLIIELEGRYLVVRLLREEYSPEQIGLWLKKTGRLSICNEWIYLYIHQDNRRGGHYTDIYAVRSNERGATPAMRAVSRYRTDALSMNAP